MADKKVEVQEEFAGATLGWLAGLFGQCSKKPSTEDDLKFDVPDKKQKKVKTEKKEKKENKEKKSKKKYENTPEPEVAAPSAEAKGTACKIAEASFHEQALAAPELAPQLPIEVDKSPNKAGDDLAEVQLAGAKLAVESGAAEPELKSDVAEQPPWFTRPSIGTWLMIPPQVIAEPAVPAREEEEAPVFEANLAEKLEVEPLPVESQLVEWYHVPSVGTWLHRVAPVKCATIGTSGAKIVEVEQEEQLKKFADVTNQAVEGMVDVLDVKEIPQ